MSGPIVGICHMCPFLTAPGPICYLSENEYFHKMKDISITVWQVPHIKLLAKVGILYGYKIG